MKKTVLILFLLALAIQSSGQEIVFRATTNKDKLAVGDYLTLSFELNASGNSFSPPSLSENFRVLSGPNKSSQMSFVNGKVSSTLTYSYVISPLNQGNYTIGPASIRFENKTYKSQPLNIQVVAASEKKKDQQQKSKEDDLSDKLFIRVEVDKKAVYQGQQLIATYKLYNRTSLNGIEGQKLPEFNGFYTSDIEINTRTNRRQEAVGNQVFDVYTIKKTILIPQITGSLELKPIELSANVRMRQGKPINTLFGPQYNYVNKKITLKSNSIKITVKGLPAGAPASFNGAVGKFKLSSSVDKENLEVNDALNYVVSLSGSGNISLIDPDAPEFPSDFELYDPKTKSNISNKSGVMSGSRSWEYLAIPRHGGSYTIPPLEFTYFNPSSESYITLKSKGFTISVGGSGNLEGDASGASRILNKQEVRQMGQDIRYLKKGKPALREKGASFFGSNWHYFWLLFTPGALGLLFLIVKRNRKLYSNTREIRKRRASKIARNTLRKASVELKTGNEKAYYEALFKAINGYVADKLSLPIGALNHDNIELELRDKEVPEDLISRWKEVIKACEMARFAPQSSGQAEDLLEKSSALIVELENKLK
jgi:hypothetical protein